MSKSNQSVSKFKLSLDVPKFEENIVEPKETDKDKNKIRDDYELTHVINDLKVKDPNSYTPITIPFQTNVTEENQNVAGEFLNSANELKEDDDDIYVFQFPRIIPVPLDTQTVAKKEEISTEEPVIDSNGFLVKNEFQNVFKELPRNSKIGKLKIYKSGKVKMQIGDVLFDVDSGVNCNFVQELAVVTGDEISEVAFLGKLRENKLIVTPELGNI